MMKLLPFVVLCAISCIAQAEILLTGVLTLDGQTKATFRDGPAGQDSTWLAEGADCNGFRILKIDATSSSATLVKDGKEVVLRLEKAKVQLGPAPVIASAPENLEIIGADELHARGYHRTEKGETPAKIAKRMGITLAELRLLNPNVNWAALRVGQVLKFKAPEGK